MLRGIFQKVRLSFKYSAGSKIIVGSQHHLVIELLFVDEDVFDFMVRIYYMIPIILVKCATLGLISLYI